MGERGIPWDVRSRDQEGVFSGAPLFLACWRKSMCTLPEGGLGKPEVAEQTQYLVIAIPLRTISMFILPKALG